MSEKLVNSKIPDTKNYFIYFTYSNADLNIDKYCWAIVYLDLSEQDSILNACKELIKSSEGKWVEPYLDSFDICVKTFNNIR